MSQFLQKLHWPGSCQASELIYMVDNLWERYFFKTSIAVLGQFQNQVMLEERGLTSYSHFLYFAK